MRVWEVSVAPQEVRNTNNAAILWNCGGGGDYNFINFVIFSNAVFFLVRSG